MKENFLDRVVTYFDPIRGYRRQRARAFTALTGAYTGALLGRRTLGSWAVLPQDADSALLPDLQVLRERSRDLVRNNPLGTGAVNTAVTNVVGTGLKLQARPDREILNMTDEEADQWEGTIEREFRMWSTNPQYCDMRKTLAFADQQDLVFRQTLENGDVFTLTAREVTKDFPYSLRLQIIEADRVCNKDLANDTETLSAGVEKEKSGAPKNYHIMDQHPGNWIYRTGYTWQVVPAFGEKSGLRNVIHNFRTLRPGQTRGTPWLAPVIETLKQLGRYTDAEVMASVIGALFTVFIKTEGPFPTLGPMQGDATVSGSVTTQDKDLKLGNGALIGLRPNESIDIADPKRPNTAFDAFIKAVLEQVGVALEIPFEILIGHFSASYSASRAALLEAWRFFRGRRRWLASSYCQPVYENFLAEGIALGRIHAPGFFSDPLLRNAYCGAIWIGDAPSQINPVDEVNAAEKRLKNGLSTLDEETTNMTGGDFETNYPRIKKERGMMKAIGMEFKEPGSFGGGAVQNQNGPGNQQQDMGGPQQ